MSAQESPEKVNGEANSAQQAQHEGSASGKPSPPLLPMPQGLPLRKLRKIVARLRDANRKARLKPEEAEQKQTDGEK